MLTPSPGSRAKAIEGNKRRRVTTYVEGSLLLEVKERVEAQLCENLPRLKPEERPYSHCCSGASARRSRTSLLLCRETIPRQSAQGCLCRPASLRHYSSALLYWASLRS